MANKFRYAAVLAALLSVAGCVTPKPQTMLDPAEVTRQHTDWRAANCLVTESDHDCVGRLSVALEATVPNIPPDQMRADEAECRLNAQMATVNTANDGTLFYGAINQAFQADRLYGTCMQMKAAQHAAYGN